SRVLHLHGWAAGGERLAVPHAHRGRRVGWLHLHAGAYPGRLVDRLVVGEHRLLLGLGQARPGLLVARGRRAPLLDQQHELHRFLLLEVVALKTNGAPQIDTSATHIRVAANPAGGSGTIAQPSGPAPAGTGCATPSASPGSA